MQRILLESERKISTHIYSSWLGIKKFYAEIVKQLPKNHSRGWWKIINTLSGWSNLKSSFSLQRDGKHLTNDELV